MAKRQSAGLLLYKFKDGELNVLVAHPGGPFYVKKDNGVWSIPKGLYEDDEDSIDAAKREYEEEIGSPPPNGPYMELGEVKRKDGKTIKAWAVEGNIDESRVKSNDFEMEWPPKSGQVQEFPEIDKAGWFDLGTASQKIQNAQVPFLERLAKHLKIDFSPAQDSTTSPEQYRLL